MFSLLITCRALLSFASRLVSSACDQATWLTTIYLSIYLSIYIYKYIHIQISIYIYTYIHIHTKEGGAALVRQPPSLLFLRWLTNLNHMVDLFHG